MTPSTRPYEHLHVARERCVATLSVPQVNGIMMFIFGMQMMVQAQYNVRGRVDSESKKKPLTSS